MPKRFSHKLYGLIGNPIEHSLSPYMHNAAFSRLKIDAAYLPFPVDKARLKEAISALRTAGISGFNVTIPFKSECMKYLDSTSAIAKSIGAVNTVINKNNRLIGYNTDYAGFLKGLKHDLGIIPGGKNVFLLGAGGAARAIAFALAKSRAKRIIVYDIIPAKAKSLIRLIKKSFPKNEIISSGPENIRALIKDCQLIVNCTPLGMRPDDALPIKEEFLHKNIRVYDIIYNPLETKLIKLARRKSIKAANGINMLLYQGVLSFELWTKKKAPVPLMRKELLDNLK
jgi:shikimate dehydrogenase